MRTRALPYLALILLLGGCNLLQPARQPRPSTTPSTSVITWEPAAPSPQFQMEAQSTVVKGKLYTFGGYTDGAIMPKSFATLMYDLT